MEFIFERIHVPDKHTFITRKLPLQSNSKIHSHKNFELNFINSGTGRRIVGDNISSFESGDFVLLAPNLPHSWEVIASENDKKPYCTVTHFSEDVINSDFFRMPELERVVALLKEAKVGIRFKVKDDLKIRKILNKMSERKGLSYYIELLKIFNYLIKIDQKEGLSNPMNLSSAFTENLEKINKIYEYVFLNIQDGVKLDEAAAVLHMAPSSFCRFFKKKTKVTFMEYVKSVRIGIAAKLLAESNKQITNICYECGYNNLANFNHYFKKTMGQTPSEYRNKFRNN